jgi:DNA (cytosine-5)-methyltransferase 1
MDSSLNFVSLFAGVGGFDLGLERAGHKCVGQVEIDKKCLEVLEKHWPNVPKHNDVVTAKEWANETKLIGKVDLVAGGFPCQDVSVAGKRAGLAGKRTGLFFDALSFATHVKAKTIILENVPGLLSSNNGRDFGVVLSSLANAGYNNIEWRVLDSQFFGVPQRRKRVFVIASVGNEPFRKVLTEFESSRRDFKTLGEKRERITEDSEGGVRTFVKAKRAQTVEDNETWVEGETVPTLNAFDVGDTRATTAIIQPVLFQGNRVGDPRFYENGVSPTVMSRWGTGGNNVPLTLEKTVRRLTPIECERLQGFPDNWTVDQADSNRYKQMGNAVTVPVVEWIGKRL